MRILLISHTCMSEEGQPRAAHLARKSGMDLCVLTPNRWLVNGAWRAVKQPECASYSFHSRKVFLPHVPRAHWYLHGYPDLPALLRAFRPDIIDLWEEPWSLVSAQTCWLRDRILPGTRVLLETEQNIYRRLPPPFCGFQRRSLLAADAAIARNREAVRVLRRKGFPGPVKVVPNGVDANLFRPMSHASCRREWNMTGFVVGYVGRLVAGKGISDVLEALVRLPADINLLCVGEGGFRATLEAEVNGLKLQGRVRFLPQQPQAVLPRILNALDALILPSRTTPTWKEQFGRVLIEAQACGIPVIGSNSGAIPEVVGKAGLIVSEGDPRALADAIRCVYDSPEVRRNLGCLGRARVEELFTWERVAAQTHALYCELLEKERIS